MSIRQRLHLWLWRHNFCTLQGRAYVFTVAHILADAIVAERLEAERHRTRQAQVIHHFTSPAVTSPTPLTVTAIDCGGRGDA